MYGWHHYQLHYMKDIRMVYNLWYNVDVSLNTKNGVPAFYSQGTHGVVASASVCNIGILGSDPAKGTALCVVILGKSLYYKLHSFNPRVIGYLALAS